MSIYRNENGELLDLKVIGQIVSAIGILNIFPSKEDTVKFLVPLINTVPGCHTVNFCFGSSSDPQGNLNDEKCTICKNKSAKELNCVLTEQGNIHSYPLETVIQLYGYLNVQVEDDREFVKYESFVRNLANAFALILENNAHKKELQLQNELLEHRVEERTAELQKLNAQFSSVLESSSDIIVMMNTAYQYILFNDAFYREHKKLFEKEVKKGDSLLLAYEKFPEAFTKAKKDWDRVLAGEDYIITKVFEKNGLETNRYESHFSPIYNAEGNVIGGVEIARNISEYKSTADLLKNSEEKYRTLLKNLDVGVLLQGPNAEILMSNDKAIELLGINEDQLLGKTSFDSEWNVIHEDGSDFSGSTHPVPTAFATLKAVKDVVMGVYHPLKKERVWLMVNAVPQFNVNGAFINVICTFSNITKNKKMETELLSQLLHYKMLMQTSQDAIHILDNKGKLIEWNESFKNHLSYPDEKLALMHVWDWSITRNTKEVLELLSDITDEGFTLEAVHQKADGSLRNMEVLVHRFVDKGEKYYYSSARDITERKNLKSY